MIEPSNGTLGSFLKSGGGIMLIVYAGISLLIAIFGMAAGIGVSIYSEGSRDSDGFRESSRTGTQETDNEAVYTETVPEPPRAATPARQTAPATVYFSGTGSMDSQTFSLDRGVARFTITSQDGIDFAQFTLVDAIGLDIKALYSGAGSSQPFIRTIEIPYSDYYGIEIETSGSWSVTIEQLQIGDS